MESHNICRKCLIREMMGDQAEFFRKLRISIDELDESVRADDELYERRLCECKKCDLLMEGMCRACGCYVELRAAIRENICPYEKW